MRLHSLPPPGDREPFGRPRGRFELLDIGRHRGAGAVKEPPFAGDRLRQIVDRRQDRVRSPRLGGMQRKPGAGDFVPAQPHRAARPAHIAAETVCRSAFPFAFDWTRITLLKDGNDDNYLIGPPGSAVEPLLRGLPVVVTPVIAVDKFLFGDFGSARRHPTPRGLGGRRPFWCLSTRRPPPFQQGTEELRM